MIVSASRGLARDERGAVIDPYAAALLPGAIGAALARYDATGRARGHGLARALSLGLVDHLALRTLAIDTALRDALAEAENVAGVRAQLVILGAGLDARAYRVAELASLPVFEIDHPATQAYKLARLGGLPARPALRHVAVDFARDALDERLAAAGHDATRPTVWIWEGVTPYLSPEAVRATLAQVASRSAPGSTVIASYVTPDKVNASWLLDPLSRPLFLVLGEPLGATYTPAAASALASDHGLTVILDEGLADWEARFGRAHRGLVRLSERVVSARKQVAGASG